MFCCLLTFAGSAFAQHCPFDGAELVVVRLMNSQGKPIAGAKDNLSLREIDNPHPDACTYAEGLLSRPFSTPLDIFKTYDYFKPSELTDEYCAGCSFLSEGYYAVNLSMGEETCMIKKGQDFDYKPRKFEVLYNRDQSLQKVAVPKDRIYSLCTANGRWSRIKPIDLKLKAAKH